MKRCKYDDSDTEPWLISGSVRLYSEGLYSEEKALFMNGDWISDTLIHAAQLLMRPS